MTNLDDLVLLFVQFSPKSIFKFINTHTCHRRDKDDGQIQFLQFLGRLQFFEFLFVDSIYLRNGEDTCLGKQFGVILLQFVEQDLIFLHDIFTGRRNHKEQYCVAFYMTQETQSETFSLACAFNNTGYICHTERTTVAVGDDAQLGRKRSKRIVCYLGFGCRDHTKQRTLAGIGKSHETDICQHLELHNDGAFLGRFTGLCITRSLVGSSTEMPVT